MRSLTVSMFLSMVPPAASACPQVRSLDLREMLAADLIILADVEGYEIKTAEISGNPFQYAEISVNLLEYLKGSRAERTADRRKKPSSYIDQRGDVRRIRWETGSATFPDAIEPGRYFMALDWGVEGGGFFTLDEMPFPPPALLLREEFCAGFYIFNQQTDKHLFRALTLIFDGYGDVEQEIDFTAAVFGMGGDRF